MSKWHSNESPAERYYKSMRQKIVSTYGPERTRFIPKSVDVEFLIDVTAECISNHSMDQASAEADSVVHSTVCHMEFERLGRPTYLVSEEVFKVCYGLDVGAEDYCHVFEKLPYSCFAFCFERGLHVKFKGEFHQMESVFVCNNPSVFREYQCLFEEKLKTHGGSVDKLFTPQKPFVMICFGGTKIALLDDATVAPCGESAWCATLKVVVSLIMLWRSRPEFVVDVSLPRSDRYRFKGDRKLIRTWRFPDKLIVRKPQGESESTGRHVKAHWRAGHFRHYRHERFAREPDGSVKVEFIAPCMIHADELAGATP